MSHDCSPSCRHTPSPGKPVVRLADDLPPGATGRLLVVCLEPDLRRLLNAHREHAERGSNRTRSEVVKATREFLEGVVTVQAEVKRQGEEDTRLVREASPADLAAAVLLGAGGKGVRRGR